MGICVQVGAGKKIVVTSRSNGEYVRPEERNGEEST